MDNNKTIYISDLDGTLLNRDSVLSDYSKAALNKLISSGVHFTVASGRTTDAAEILVAGIVLDVPIVTFNGVVIYDTKQKRYTKVYRLDTEAVGKTVSVLKSHKHGFG